MKNNKIKNGTKYVVKNVTKFVFKTSIKPIIEDATKNLVKGLMSSYFMMDTGIEIRPVPFFGDNDSMLEKHLYEKLDIKNYRIITTTRITVQQPSRFYYIKKYKSILEFKPCIKNNRDEYTMSFYKLYIYGTKNNIMHLYNYIQKIKEEYDSKKERVTISSRNNVKKNDIKNIIYVSKYKNDILNKVENHINYFSENTSNTNNIFRGISFLMYGKPGTGKTSIGNSILYEFKNNISNYEKIDKYSKFENFIENFTGSLMIYKIDDSLKVKNNKFELIIIDEIDLILKEENVKNPNLLSDFLNFLDNIPPYFIVVMSTNNIEKLPEALLRDGRCDFKYEICDFDENELKEYFKEINLSKEIFEDFIGKELESTNPAYLNNIYVQYCKHTKNKKIN